MIGEWLFIGAVAIAVAIAVYLAVTPIGAGSLPQGGSRKRTADIAQTGKPEHGRV